MVVKGSCTLDQNLSFTNVSRETQEHILDLISDYRTGANLHPLTDGENINLTDFRNRSFKYFI